MVFGQLFLVLNMEIILCSFVISRYFLLHIMCQLIVSQCCLIKHNVDNMGLKKFNLYYEISMPLYYCLHFITKIHWVNSGLIGTSFMVCPWLLHGFSIENPQIDGQTMDEPWTNHGGTMDKPIINPMSFFIKIFPSIQ
jgi:hypothetical protein